MFRTTSSFPKCGWNVVFHESLGNEKWKFVLVFLSSRPVWTYFKVNLFLASSYESHLNWNMKGERSRHAAVLSKFPSLITQNTQNN